MLPVRIKGRTIMKRKLPKKLRQKTRSWRKRKESRTHEPSKWTGTISKNERHNLKPKQCSQYNAISHRTSTVFVRPP